MLRGQRLVDLALKKTNPETTTAGMMVQNNIKLSLSWTMFEVKYHFALYSPGNI